MAQFVSAYVSGNAQFVVAYEAGAEEYHGAATVDGSVAVVAVASKIVAGIGSITANDVVSVVGEKLAHDDAFALGFPSANTLGIKSAFEQAQVSETSNVITVGSKGVLETIVLVSPSDANPNVSKPITFVWQEFIDALDYEIQVALEDTFASPVIDEVVAGLFYETSALVDETEYFWRVRARLT